ncbi:MAG: hypothetical protein V7K26_28430 [Nostoc sp.]
MSVFQHERVKQIMASQNAINQALQRRGLSDTYELDVEIVGRYCLRPKV